MTKMTGKQFLKIWSVITSIVYQTIMMKLRSILRLPPPSKFIIDGQEIDLTDDANK